jgi:hypothetical protein
MSTELATTTEITTIEPKRWGRDHWSLLGYIATCFDGEIDRRKLRCNENRHPMLAHCHSAWKDEWSTRLKSTPEGEHIKAIGHDDWDCLDDLEAAGPLKRNTKSPKFPPFSLCWHGQCVFSSERVRAPHRIRKPSRLPVAPKK